MSNYMVSVTILEPNAESRFSVDEPKTHGTAIAAAWCGHTKNGYVTVHVLSSAGEYPAKAAVEVGQVHLPELLNVVAERKVGREAMIEALRRQRLKVSFEEWTEADERVLVEEYRREAEQRERQRLARLEQIERERQREEAEESERQELMARSNSSRKEYLSLETLRAAEARRTSPQNERNRVIREAVDAANGEPVQVACEFALPDGSKRTAIMAVTTVKGVASSAEAEIRSQVPGLRQHAAKLISMTLVKEGK
ncbi:hypothetical protein [Mesorhizobium sp. M00.F.Ca.ET.216.01.1.1]|uniref:hypothetical protein n=1 Tax=Mesorhizobium sp. M00.F.Ca.ET.216.01.1.1 TaxID=2500528 RepID=UPI000FD8E810|nr:hypothetical protein [Mesorhizobium sp. M00.F.Ca.ET.216.01.1.1]TGQ47622.1 hypothetical protein EN859_000075 [Mesorhizobium sp. M00.F.Ca.ET.216.01.1.1]